MDANPRRKALNATVPADFVAHTSSRGVSLKALPTWKEKPVSGAGPALMVMAPDGKTSVNVVVVDSVPPTRDPDAIAQQVKKEVGVQLSGFTLKTAEGILVAGEVSPRIVYEGSMMGSTLRLQQTMVIKNGKTFIVTFTALPADYDKYAATVDQILASMTFP